jgi:hypothetical protein
MVGTPWTSEATSIESSSSSSAGDPTGSGSSGADGTTSGSTTSALGGTSSGSTDASGTTGIPVPESCAAYADLITLCYDEASGTAAAMYCGETLSFYEMTYGAQCVAVFEEYLACLSSLTCEMLAGKDLVCEKESQTVEMFCAPP